MGGEVGDAVSGEAGADQADGDTQRELGPQPGGRSHCDEVGKAAGVGGGQFAGGEKVVV